MAETITDNTAIEAVPNEVLADVASTGGNIPVDKLSMRNLIMFSVGTFGRDFLYNFFATYLLSFILFTKNLTTAQFSSISIIIICARIFDAFNDPIMGGIVENTRTKWGKYKPWQLIGSVLTSAVIVALFSVKLDGWDYIAFLAVGYLMFSITFTMNDISYWGMMPTLTSNEHDRNKLMSFAQLVASGGAGLVGLLVPMLTAGSLSLPGGAPTGYMIIAIVAAVLMVGFQMFTIFGVQEKMLPANFVKVKRMTIKDMFKTIAKNDQLLWCTIVLLLWCTGPAVVGGGLYMSYVYFEFGYEGGWLTLLGIGGGITSTLFTVFYPWVSKKWGRNKVLYSTVAIFVVGYILMMVFGLTIPNQYLKAKMVMIAIANTLVGFGNGFYMIMVINIANTVEYNEWKTGNREEGLIFSLRPFTAKLGSALMQGLVLIVYIVSGVLKYTNGISNLENLEAQGKIDKATKLVQIQNIIDSVSVENKTVLLCCMCLIPIVFVFVATLIYKKKCFLDEKTLQNMIAETSARKLQNNYANDMCCDEDNTSPLNVETLPLPIESAVAADIAEIVEAETELPDVDAR